MRYRVSGALALVVLTVSCSRGDERGAVVDLTHPLAEGIPLYPGGMPFTIERKAELERDGYFMNSIRVGEHTGTHLDAPAHFIAGGVTVDQIPAGHLVGPGAVIDVRGQCGRNHDYEVTVRDIKEWEAANGRMANGSILLIRTGWGERWPEPKKYLNADEGDVLHYPGLSVELVKYLAKYRDVSGVGIDTLSIDHGPSTDFRAHKVLLADGIYLIENVANLSRLPPTGATIVVAPLAIRGGSGAPCRVLALLPAENESVRTPSGEKFLIEFGWDIPDARTLAAAAAADTPFDGAVFDPQVTPTDGKSERFSWMAFGARAVLDADVRRIVNELARTPAEFRRRSFLRMNVTPGDVDWFEDWTAILTNARAAARIIRAGKLAGVLFDVEQYQGKIFDFRARPKGKDFAAYEQQAKRRGAEFIQVMSEAGRSLELLLTYGYSLADRDRPRAEYGLLPAFLDGLCSVRNPNTRIIDGYEYAYPFKDRRAFERGRQEILRDSDGRLGVGFGIWLDWNSGARGWSADRLDKNWFSPDEFGAAVRHALDFSDKYVWIYSERLNWWTHERLPSAYHQALEKASSAR